MKTRAILCAFALLLCQLEAKAGIIDFESGFVDLQPVVAPIVTGDNTVTIGTPGIGTPHIAGVGDPRSAFTTTTNPNVGNDQPDGGNPGRFFLNDENNVNGNLRAANYTFAFDIPILEMSLDIYDFRGDGQLGFNSNDVATLTLYSDLAMTNIVGTGIYDVPDIQPIDGNVASILVDNLSGLAVAAMLDLNGMDVGVGVDNIRFSSFDPGPKPVPEPSTFVLLGMGSIGLIGFGYRRKKAAKAKV